MSALVASPAKTAITVPLLDATRFTVDGSDQLEGHLDSACQQVLTGVGSIMPPRIVEALLLAGGYGRGEGGVLKTPTGDRPYNDLEFYILVRGNPWLNRRRYSPALSHLAHELTTKVGVEVEFKITSAAKLQADPPSMFYYDLVAGHRRIMGDEAILAHCEHHQNPHNIPLSEAARLLMNRCTGLLLARERLKQKTFTPDDADFVARNLAKAQLAFGDAVLTAFGQYHWSCRKRHERLLRLHAVERLPWFDELRRHHAAGVEFKLHPFRTPDPQTRLQSRLDEIVAFALPIWLWLENGRLDCRFGSAREYALDPADKCPETNPWRNRLIHAAAFGPAAFWKRNSRRHPRERIFNSLPLLLWESFTHEPALQNHLHQQLKQAPGGHDNLIEVFLNLWRLFT